MIVRYETPEMRAIWAEEAQLARWTKVELAACETFAARGEISSAELEQLRSRARVPTADRVRELEKVTNHDLVAFVRALSENVGEPASRHLHRGLTSSDVVDTALAMALTDALEVVVREVEDLRAAIAKRAWEFKDTPCAGRTHGVHAEPTTFGLRLAGWYAELGRHLERLRAARMEAAHAKLSGAVGTFSQTDPSFEAETLERLSLFVEPIATQVVPRDRHAFVFTALALLGAGLERFATEVRALQRTDVREAEEPFRAGQTGSSAMPHKRNPISCERVCGMARLLRGYAMAGLEDVALWHDRDISHSSVERVALPDAFHLAHYMTRVFRGVVEGMHVYPDTMRANMDKTRGLLFSQSALGALLAGGMDRQAAYAIVQRHAMRVWNEPTLHLEAELASDPEVAKCVPREALAKAFQLDRYTQYVDTLFARAGLSAATRPSKS